MRAFPGSECLMKGPPLGSTVVCGWAGVAIVAVFDICYTPPSERVIECVNERTSPARSLIATAPLSGLAFVRLTLRASEEAHHLEDHFVTFSGPLFAAPMVATIRFLHSVCAKSTTGDRHTNAMAFARCPAARA